MDDCIGRLVASDGVDRTAAEKAVAIVLQFLSKEGPNRRAAAPETIAFAREAVGEEAAGEPVGAIPGLGQFV